MTTMLELRKHQVNRLQWEREEMEAEIERLRAENERLRAALEQANNALIDTAATIRTALK